MSSQDHEVRISVPARAEYVDVVRTTVGREAHRLGFSFDGIEDLCLAVDEATVLLLDLASSARRIEVCSTWAGTDIEVSVSAVAAGRVDWPPAALAEDIRWQVLTALAADVRIAGLGDDPSIVVRQPVR